MGVIQYSFFSLPIHEHRCEEYYRKGKQHVDQLAGEQNSQRRMMGLSELTDEDRASLDTRHALSPWYYNDVVGFLEVGMDGGDHMSADVFLRRKHFPKTMKTRFWPGTPLDNQRFEYFTEVYPKVRVDHGSNDSFLRALDGILRQAEREIRDRKARFVLYRPPFDFGCFDFGRAYRQMTAKK